MKPAEQLYRAFVRDPKTGRRLAGFVDVDGAWRIKPRFDGALYFREGLATVADLETGRDGVIDLKGRFVVPPRHEKLLWFSEGLCRFKVGPLLGYLDRDGQVKIPPAFHEAGDFHEGIAPVRVGYEGTRYIRPDGTVVASSAGPNLMRVSEGLIPLHDETSDKFGYVDLTGRERIPPQFAFAREFAEGVAAVTPKDRGESDPVGFIDHAGEFRLGPGPYIHAESFSDGLAVVTRVVRGRGKMGFIDRAFAEVIPPRFYLVGKFAGGLAPAQLAENKPWGFIDRHGDWAIEPQFEDADPFEGGLAPITTKTGRTGYVNRKGKTVWLNDPFD